MVGKARKAENSVQNNSTLLRLDGITVARKRQPHVLLEHLRGL